MEIGMKHRLVGAALIAVVAGGLIGCSNDPYRSSGRVMDDRMVKSRVKDALDESQVYKYPHVDVNTYNGVVQLNGFVHREEQKSTAAEVAKNVPGVREVINNISILPAEKAYGGTVDPSTGIRGSATNTPSSTQRNSNQ